MKKFTMEVTMDLDGSIEVSGENNGFNAFELIAFLELKKQDIIDQVNNKDKFEYKRSYIDESGEKIEVTKNEKT